MLNQKKTVKRLIYNSLVLTSLLGNLPIGVSAHTGINTSEVSWDAYDKSAPWSWYQYNGANPGMPRPNVSWPTFTESACETFSTTFLFYRSGYKTVGEWEVKDTAELIKNSGLETSGYAGHFMVSIQSDVVERLTDGFLKQVDYLVNPTTEQLKKKYDEGYFIVLNAMPTGGDHALFLDKMTGTTGDKMFVLDSGYPSLPGGAFTDENNYNDNYPGGVSSINGAAIYARSDGKKNSDFPIVSSGEIYKGNSDVSVDLKVTSGDLFGDLASEDSIAGMSSRTYLSDSQVSLSVPYVTLSGSGDVANGYDASILTAQEYKNLNDTKKAVVDRKLTTVEFLRIAMVWLAYACFIYGVSLVVSWIFDLNNSFLEFSLVSLLTVGKRTSANKAPFFNEEKTKFVTGKEIATSVIVLFSFGSFILTGMLYRIFSSLGNVILEILKNL